MPKAGNLKGLRISANLTQQQLADALGVSRKTIISWETKKTSIPAPNSKRIAEYFGTTYDDFCSRDLSSAGAYADGIHLTETEKENILLFRSLPENVKGMLRYMIHAAYEKENVM